MNFWVLVLLVASTASEQTLKGHRHHSRVYAHEQDDSQALTAGLREDREISVPTLITTLNKLRESLTATGVDLEQQVGPTNFYQGKIEKAIFDVLTMHSGRMQIDPDLEETESRLSPAAILNLGVWGDLPPILSYSEGMEQFNSFAGGAKHNSIDVSTLRTAYHELFNTTLSSTKAKGMLLSIVKDSKPKIAVNRCEFVLASMMEKSLDPQLIENAGELWKKRSTWTFDTTRFEMGLGNSNPYLLEVVESLFLDPLTRLKKHHLSKCEFLMTVAWARDSRFRSFLHSKAPATLTPKADKTAEVAGVKDLEMESFKGYEIFPHTVETHVKEEKEASKLLKQLFYACDDDGDGFLQQNDFLRFVRAIQRWNEYTPPISKIQGFPNPVQAIESSWLIEPQLLISKRSEFDDIWAKLAGEKAHYISNQKLSGFLNRVKKRGDATLSSKEIADHFRKMFQLHKFSEKLIDQEDNNKLVKPELMQALFGHPQITAMISQDELEKVFGLLTETHKAGDSGPTSSTCDRSCWVIFSPMIDAFNDLDTDSTGKLTMEEFSKIGDRTLKRIRTDNSDSSQLEEIYKQLLEKFGEPVGSKFVSNEADQQRRFGLNAFAHFFLSADATSQTISLASFVKPPKLRKKQ
jgi:Ca2+-binding EF-hand superfamily protein